jgi:hypothetical protein
MARETRESSFDELTRGLASGSISRGKAIRLMGAALVGGTLTSFGFGGVALADDRCKPTGKKCKKNAQCCSGNCVNGACSACPDGKVLLSNGTCAIICSALGECPCGDDACTGRFGNNISGICAGFNASSLIDCQTDAVCPPGEFCSINSGREQGACVSVC